MLEYLEQKGKVAVRWLLAAAAFLVCVSKGMLQGAGQVRKRVREAAGRWNGRWQIFRVEWRLKQEKRKNRVYVKRNRRGYRPLRRWAAGALAACMMVVSVPVPAFAVETVDKLPEPTIPSDDLYIRISWRTTDKVGGAASEKNCEKSSLTISDYGYSKYFHDFGNFRERDRGKFYFNRDILNNTNPIPIAEYTISQSSAKAPAYYASVLSKLGTTRSFAGEFIWEVKNLKTGNWEIINTQQTGKIKSDSQSYGTWSPNNYLDSTVGFYGTELYRYSYDNGENIFSAGKGFSHTPMLKDNILSTNITEVSPATSDTPMTYVPQGTYTLMTTYGYRWRPQPVYDTNSVGYSYTYPRMGNVTFQNPRIVAAEGENPQVITVKGVTAVADASRGFTLQVGKDAKEDDNKKFRVAFDVVSEKYGTKTTAYSNEITVKVPTQNAPAAPTNKEVTAKTITMNTIPGQKYIMTGNTTAPEISASGWKEAVDVTMKYENLTPGTTYTFWTYAPGVGVADSPISKGTNVKTTSPIDKIEVSLTAPQAGETVPRANANIGLPENMQASNLTWNQGFATYTDDTFGYGAAYTVSIPVQIKTGTTDNIFAAEVTAAVNGQTATVKRTSDTGATITYTFPETEAESSFTYKLYRDGTEWTKSAPSVRLRQGKNVYVASNSKLEAGEYSVELFYSSTGETVQIDDTVTIAVGESPQLKINFWTVQFYDEKDQPLTQGQNIQQSVYEGKSPVTPTGTVLTAPGTGKVLTWITKDSDDSGNIEETPFIIGQDSVFEKTDLYARWMTSINETEVTGLNAPVGGATPDTEVSVPGNAAYEVYDVAWSPAVENNKFAYNTEYTAKVSLIAKTGAGFAEAPSGTINGKTAVVSDTSSTIIYLSYKFPLTGKDPNAVAAAAAKTVEDYTYQVPQATANSVDDLKTWLENTINNLLTGTGVTVSTNGITIASSDFTAATEGTASSTNGSNGSFQFIAKLTTGGVTADTKKVSGTIKATAYTGDTITAAPVFTAKGAAFTKTAGNQDTADFILMTEPAAGTQYYVYLDADKNQSAAASASASGTTLTVTGDAIAGVTEAAKFYLTAKEGDKDESAATEVTVYPVVLEDTSAPVFPAGKDTYAKRSESENTASFTMESVRPEGTTYQAYTSADKSERADGVTVTGVGSSLTLTGIAGLTESTAYYISATEPEKAESSCTSVTVTPYIAPSVTLPGTDSVVTASFKSGSTGTATDTINVIFDRGSNPDVEFQASDFKIMTRYGGSEESNDLKVKSINAEQNTVTIEVTLASQYKNGYLAYQGATLGEITTDIKYTSQETDASLKTLTLSAGTLTPEFDPGTTSFKAAVPYETDGITVTPTANSSKAKIEVNNTAVDSGAASGEISLDIGQNRVTILVTAEKTSVTRTYLVDITREAPAGDSPVFTKNTYTKTSLTNDSATFTLDAQPANGTTYKVYQSANGGFALSDMKVTVSGKTLTLKDISGVVAQTDYYISATPPDKSESGRTKVTVQPYNAPAAAPGFASAQASFANGEASVSFNLTNHSNGRSYRIYRTKTDQNPLTENPGLTVAEDVMTLTYTAVPSGQTTYYVSAVESGKPESNRTEIVVKPYVAPQTSAPPAFAGGGNAYAKTSAEDTSATFTLAATPVSKTEFKVYDAVSDGSAVTVSVSVSNKTLTLTGDAVKNITETATWYVSATEPGKTESSRIAVTISPYLEQSTAPSFTATSYAKQSDNDDTAKFKLTEAGASTTDFKVYSQETGGYEATGITASLDESNSTLLNVKGIPALQREITYYISATEQGKGESSRIAVTVKPYEAPSAELADDDTVEVTFKKTEADTATKTDTIGVTLDTGSNESYEFQTTDFKVFGSSTSKTSELAGVSITAVGEGTLTVQVEKSVTATGGYVWYRDTCLGRITITKTVEEADKYDITVSSSTNGSVTASTTQAAAGATITLNISPADGYELNTLEVYKTGEPATKVTVSGTGNKKTFTMPAYAVTVTATFKASVEVTAAPVFTAGTYTKTSQAENTAEFTLNNAAASGTNFKVYEAQTGGNALINVTAAADGTTLTLTGISGVTSETDYYISATETGKSESTRTKVTVKPYTLTPVNRYAITVDSITNGEVTASSTEAEAGTTVTLNIAPADGYELNTLKVYKTGESTTKVTVSGTGNERTFTMPAYAVTVAAAFKASVGVTAAPAFTASTYTKTSAAGNTAEFTLKNAAAGGTNFKVYAAQTGGDALTDVTAAAEGITLTLTGISGVTSEMDYYISATETGKSESTRTKVTVKPYTSTGPTQSSEKKITGFTIAGQVGDTAIDQINHTVNVTMPANTDVTSLSPAITVSEKATVSPRSAQNFTNPVTYTVTAEDGTTQEYVVTVTVQTGFVVVADITELPTEGTAGTDLTLTGTVEPENATNQTITWAIVDAGTTGATLSGSTLSTTAAGTVSMKAVVEKGKSETEDYEKEFDIEIKAASADFVPVESITGVPTTATAGKACKLTGTVNPSNATNQDITWEITDDGGTGASLDDQNHLTTETGGEVTVTATIANGLGENQNYTEEFTIRVGEVASASDAAYVASASNAVRDGKYKVDQSTTEDEGSFLAELVNLINKILEKLFGTGKTEKIETSDISNLTITVDPVAGDEDDHSGSDGEFTFDVEIHKGDESQTVEGLTGTIKATPFTDEDQAAKDQEAVDNAITEIEDGTYNVQQENAGNEEALKKALKEKAKKKAGKAAVNEIQIVEVEYAAAGTLENPDGEAGTFTFKAKVSKGSVQDIWTEEIEGTIVPEEYVLKKPEITTLSLPDGTVGTEYSAQLTAKSDTEITWGLEGSLPAGLTLSEDGEISGMPEAAGQTSFKVTADNGSEQGTASRNYTITINAKTGETEHTITTVSGDGGTVNPSGAVRVADGADQKFTITPAGGYYISKVLVDGNSVGRPAEYTFRNVTGDHTIEAVFARGSVGPGTDDDDNGGGSHSSGSGSTTTGTTSKTPSTSTNTATAEGGSVTTTTTTSTDNSGKQTTVTTQVTKDTAGNVTGSTTTVTTDNIQISAGEGVSHVTVRPDGSAMNSAAVLAGATAQNPLRVQVEVPHTAAANELAKPEVQSVAVDVMIPNAAADNPNVEIGVTVGKETMQAAKDAGKNVAVTVRNENGTVEAVWSFDGAAMRNTNSEVTDVSLGLHAAPVQSEDPSAQEVKSLAAARGTENGLVLNISGAGWLTAPTKLTVPATNQTGIKAGDQVALYRHDPASGTLVPVPGGIYTVDANGNVTIDLPAKDFAAGPDRYVLLPVPAAGTVPPAIPATAGATAPYEIQRGDTLNKIAREYGCTVEELLELNQVDVMDLRIGQVIQLPAR